MNTSIYKIFLIYICIYFVFVGLYNKLYKVHGNYMHRNTYIINCDNCYCVIIISQLLLSQSVCPSVSYPFIFKYSSQTFSYRRLFESKRENKNILVQTLFVSGNSTNFLILIYLSTFVYVHLDHCQTLTQCNA